MNGTEPRTLSLLFIEDDLDMRELVEAALSRRGFQVVTCPSASDALDQLDTRQFDLVVTDLGLAKSSGWQLLQELRSHSRAPIAVLTGDREARDAAVRAGASMFFSKPVSMEVLAKELRALARKIH